MVANEMGQCIFGPCYIAPDIPFNIIAEAAVTERFSLSFDRSQPTPSLYSWGRHIVEAR